MISAITVALGTIASRWGFVAFDVVVDEGGVKITIFAPAIGRGNGGVITLTEEQWFQFKAKLVEVDQTIARVKREHGLVKTT